jgi:hypothetical protein
MSVTNTSKQTNCVYGKKKGKKKGTNIMSYLCCNKTKEKQTPPYCQNSFNMQNSRYGSKQISTVICCGVFLFVQRFEVLFDSWLFGLLLLVKPLIINL